MYSMKSSSDKFMSMEIEGGRYSDSKIFDGTQILKWIRLMEWDKVMFMRESVYAKYLREFFIHLKHERDAQQNLILKSRVNGIQIELDSRKMNDILGTENCEAKFLGSNDLCVGVGVGFKKSDMEETLWGSDTPCIMSGGDAYHRLSDSHKLLHRLIVCTILCRGDTLRATDMSNTSMCCLYAAIKGEKLNIGFLILENIVSTLNEGKKRIPYGMIFTMIFRKFGVPLEEQERESDELFDKRFLGIQNLKRMGFEKRLDGTWGFKPKKIAKRQTEGTSSDMVKIVTENLKGKPVVIHLDSDSENDCSSPKKENVSLENNTSPKDDNVRLEDDRTPKNYQSTPENVNSSPKEAEQKGGDETHGASASFNMSSECMESVMTTHSDLLELRGAMQTTISDLTNSWTEIYKRRVLDETDGSDLDSNNLSPENSKEKSMNEYHDGTSVSSSTLSTSLETVVASLNDVGASIQYAFQKNLNTLEARISNHNERSELRMDAHELRMESVEARMNTQEERMDTLFYAIDKLEKKMDMLIQLRKKRKPRVRVAGLRR